MTWMPLLLADRSALLRQFVLVELLGKPVDDPEVQELMDLGVNDDILQNILALQNEDGSFRSAVGINDSWKNILHTSHALLSLGYLGFNFNLSAVKSAAEYLYSLQNLDGSWPLPRVKSEREFREEYSMIPLQTGIPLRGLAAAGFATDSRSENGFDWLLNARLPDGSWPSGVQGGINVFPAGYRRLAHSRYGCRTNTSFAVSALSFHPELRTSDPARRGLDMLLSQEIEQSFAVGQEAARMIGVEPRRGFFTYFSRHDAAFILDLCWRIGASLDDQRVSKKVAFVHNLQGPYGLWSYSEKPEASRWVSFDILRSLSKLESNTDWLSSEPVTPFQPYPKKEKRY